MTRINVVPVQELSRQHLVAEYREITRLPKNLSNALNRKSKPFSLSEIPSQYVLGTGHVKFFFDKMKFLESRFEQLVSEMLARGYNPTYRDSGIFKNCSPSFYNDYVPTDDALRINRARIAERNGNK
jgi:deoxyribonuclease (pyrimidine dimer)